MKPHYHFMDSSYDNGGSPYVTDLQKDTLVNYNFRSALWTGEHLQVTMMSIAKDSEIGIEVHPTTDQMLYIESGTGYVLIGPNKDHLNHRQMISSGYAIFIPAGYWHNILNNGSMPLKLFSVYAPPEHPYGTVHETIEDAIAAEKNDHMQQNAYHYNHSYM